MRLDHIAYRVKDRNKSAQFFINAFGYRIQQEFEIDFPDGTKVKCIALEPPEKPAVIDPKFFSWTHGLSIDDYGNLLPDLECGEYHIPPEIFVSDGPAGSIVGDWVEKRGGVGGIHHMAYQVDNVEQTMKEWLEKGYAEFLSEKPLTCPGLTQVFTKPSQLTGVIYEFIERDEFGFCKENVAGLMTSTKDVDKNIP